MTMFDGGKTGMIGLMIGYGEKTMTICSAVFIQYQRVTDGQTDGQTDRIAISISRVSLLTRDKNRPHYQWRL